MKGRFAFLLAALLVAVSCGGVDEIVIEAENMEPNEGIQSFVTEKDHVRMNGGGEIKGTVTIPFEGRAQFHIRAKGEKGGDAYPLVELKLNGNVISSVNVESDDWQVFRIDGEISKGQNEIALAYVNDFYAPPEDRNLLVDSITIRKAGKQ